MDWQTLTRNSSRSDRRLVLGSQPPSWSQPSNFQSWGKPKIVTWRPLPLWVQRGQACASEQTRAKTRLGRAVSPQILNRVSTSDVRRPGPRDQSYCSAPDAGYRICNLNFLLVTCTQVGGANGEGGLRCVLQPPQSIDPPLLTFWPCMIHWFNFSIKIIFEVGHKKRLVWLKQYWLYGFWMFLFEYWKLKVEATSNFAFHQLGFSSESWFLKIHHISFNRRRRQQIYKNR